MKKILKDGKPTGFEEQQGGTGVVVHTCDRNLLPHAEVETPDQVTTVYICKKCKKSVTIVAK